MSVSRSTSPNQLSDAQVAEIVAQACPVESYRGKRVLLIVPDGTRTAPVGLMFKTLHRQIGARRRRPSTCSSRSARIRP